MSFSLRIGLISFAAILILILIIISIYFYYLFKKNHGLKILNQLKSEVKKEILVKADRVIIQIKKIVQQNSSYFTLLQKLTKLYDQIEHSINQINQKIKGLQLKYSTYSLRKFSVEIKKIKDHLNDLEKLSQQFSMLCYEFTEKDEFIRSEMVFLKNCLRDIIDQYRQNRVLLNEIAIKIDEFLRDLNDLEREFDLALNGGEVKGASAFLELYENKVYQLALIVNEGPVIKTHIFHNIPNRTQELINDFNLKKTQSPNQFNHITIDRELDKLVKIHRQARTQFELLAFDLAKISIKQCHEIISMINQNINLEITTSNFFTQNYNSVIFEVNKSLQRYISLRKKYRIILDHGYEGNFELSDIFEELSNLSKEIDTHGSRLKDIRQDVQIPFSSKLSKLKIMMNLLLKFVELENQVEKIIWLYNVESIIFKNKFQKLESAVNEIIVNMRNNNIIVSPENESNLELITQQIVFIGEAIYKDKLTSQVKEKIDNLVEKVTHLYSAVGGELQIAEITKNMINELTKRRSVDARLGYVLNMAEKDYMVGKYTEALNNIITFLGEKSYARV